MRSQLSFTTALRWVLRGWFITAVAASDVAAAAPNGPYVEFDFPRTVDCRDVTPPGRAALSPGERIVEMRLGVSVRFRGVAAEDVEELDIEIGGATTGLRVAAFAPTTQLASDINQPIETTTTTKQSTSLDGTLGGSLPIPYAELVAHLTPSINAGTSRSESSTETVSRLPPRRAVVVSGTSSAGHGVFFKFKRSSQTSLEGRHELTVAFILPADWEGGTIRIGASARGQRKLLWIKQPATLGRAAGDVTLRLVSDTSPREASAEPHAEPAVQAEKLDSQIDELRLTRKRPKTGN